MRKYTLLPILYIAVILTSCVTAPEENERIIEDKYYEVEELLESYVDGIEDRDAEQYIGTFWPDCESYMYIEGKELSGRKEIAEGFTEIASLFPEDDYEYPQAEMFSNVDGITGTYRVHYVHRELGIREILYLEKRGEIWGIAELETESYTPYEINSPLQSWADENNNGEFEEAELTEYLDTAATMFFKEHQVKDGFSKAFDSNKDGFIDREEIEMFRQICFGIILPGLLYSDPEAANEIADLNADGNIEEQEIAALQKYLTISHPEKLPRIGVSKPLLNLMDTDDSGGIDQEEHSDFYYDIIDQLLLYPYPPNPLASLFEEDSFGFAAETGVYQRNSDRIEGRRLAVLTFDNMIDAEKVDQVQSLALFTENAFVSSRRVTVVDRNNIDKIIEEHSFQTRGLTDDSTAVEIGKLAGAEIIVTGSFGIIEDTYFLQLKLIDIGTGEIIASSIAESRDKSGFKNMCEQAVQNLF